MDNNELELKPASVFLPGVDLTLWFGLLTAGVLVCLALLVTAILAV